MGKLFSYIKDAFESLFKDKSLKPIKFEDLKEIDPEKHDFICSNLKNGKFCDPYFRPNINAFVQDKNPLIDYNSILDEDSLKLRNKEIKEQKDIYETCFNEDLDDESDKKLKWERISSILKLKEEKSNLSHKLNQNSLGDCYLISFLRGLMEFQKERYWKLFGACFPEIGYYEIYFFNEKKENVLIYVDDYIIVDNQLKPYFASLDEKSKFGVGRSILIEKAYAKLNGSYFNINGSYQIGDPLFYFTGFKSLNIYNLNSYNNEDLYATIKEHIKAKDVITTSTPSAPKKKDENGNEIEFPFPISGIYYNHAYTVWKGLEKKKI